MDEIINIPDRDNSNKYDLTLEQQSIILKKWNSESPPSISDLIRAAYPQANESECDGRSKYGRIIKQYLANKHLKAETKTEYKLKTGLVLTPEQEEYLLNNCKTDKPMDMARVLFNNMKLSPASAEVRAVSDFCRTIDPRILYSGEIPDTDYKPPTTIDRLVARIKKYVKEAESWDYRKLTPRQRKQSNSLLGYLHAFRFKHQIDCYDNTNDKILFESTFIKYTFDKDDLTQEEIDQYILLCDEIITLTSIQRTVDSLEREQDRIINEEGKLNMQLVEAVKNAREERNQCTKRQQALYKALTQERSKKLSEEIKDKASLLSLFQAWKNHESRQNLLKLRMEQKENLRKELHEIDNMDELKIKILGLSFDDILER